MRGYFFGGGGCLPTCQHPSPRAICPSWAPGCLEGCFWGRRGEWSGAGLGACRAAGERGKRRRKREKEREEGGEWWKKLPGTPFLPRAGAGAPGVPSPRPPRGCGGERGAGGPPLRPSIAGVPLAGSEILRLSPSFPPLPPPSLLPSFLLQAWPGEGGGLCLQSAFTPARPGDAGLPPAPRPPPRDPSGRPRPPPAPPGPGEAALPSLFGCRQARPRMDFGSVMNQVRAGGEGTGVPSPPSHSPARRGEGVLRGVASLQGAGATRDIRAGRGGAWLGVLSPPGWGGVPSCRSPRGSRGAGELGGGNAMLAGRVWGGGEGRFAAGWQLRAARGGRAPRAHLPASPGR